MDDAKKPMARPRIAGLVLAGGQSRRFGREKAAEPLNGRPMLAWSLAALDACCEGVAVSAAAGSRAEALARADGRRVVHDTAHFPAGPLAGLAAGLAWAAGEGFDLLVTTPCDTPLISDREIRTLIDASGGRRAAYAITADGAHGLCAAWPVSIGEMLTSELTAGRHPAVLGLLRTAEATAVPFADPRVFRNVNTQEDLAGTLAMWPGTGRPAAH